MKIFQWSLIIFGLLFLLFSSFASAFGLIGVAIYLAGIWLFYQKQKGISYREKPWMAFTLGIITTVVLVLIFVEEVPEEPAKSSEVKTEQRDSGK
jgi:membrane-bound ClpP family serine protease